jgi:hypothetical protein
MSYCVKCGTEEVQGQKFCPVCGTPSASASMSVPMPPLSSTEMSAYAQVLVGLSLDPPHQARWSIFFRLLLVLPLYVASAFVGLATFFVVVAAWFVALFTGHVPDGLQRFITGYIRLYSTISAYTLLLIPKWPGLVFHEGPNDQLALVIEHVSLNRAAVFFRIILVYPAGIVSGILSIGSYPLLVIMWFWGLITGRIPEPLHQTLALILRYQTRLLAYVLLTSPTQPFRGLLGDGVASSPSIPNAGSGESDVATSSLPTRWVVAKDTRTYVIVALVLGVVLYAVQYGRAH